LVPDQELAKRLDLVAKTEVALVASPDVSPATLRLAEFCNTVQAKAA
jgi:hypothetical protein